MAIGYIHLDLNSVLRLEIIRMGPGLLSLQLAEGCGCIGASCCRAFPRLRLKPSFHTASRFTECLLYVKRRQANIQTVDEECPDRCLGSYAWGTRPALLIDAAAGFLLDNHCTKPLSMHPVHGLCTGENGRPKLGASSSFVRLETGSTKAPRCMLSSLVSIMRMGLTPEWLTMLPCVHG